MKQGPPRKIKLMIIIILLITGAGGIVMSIVLNNNQLIAILGSVNLAFASFIGIRYIQSKPEKEKE